MANLLEDEDKILKALNKVLELNSSHGGARKKLAEMRPDLAQNLAPLDSTENVKASADWSKINNAPPFPKQHPLGGCARAIGVRIILFLIVGAIAAAYGFWNEGLPRMRQVDDNGQTPADVVMAYTIATLYEDVATMRALSCDVEQYRADEVEQEIAELGALPDDFVADLSKVTTEVVRLKLNEATVALHGDVHMSAGGQTFDFNYDQDAREQDVEWIWEHLKRIDGLWLICEGPEFIYQ